MTWRVTVVLAALGLCCTACTGEVANPSFEEGREQPAGWTLSGGRGAWENEGHTGARCVSVWGTGEDSNFWRSSAEWLKPRATYRLTVWVRAEQAPGGGCILVGTSFCNRDINVGPKWTKYSFVFVTPAKLEGEYFRLGQWRRRGRVWFDDISVQQVLPLVAEHEGVALGEGERVVDQRYVFEPAWSSETSNYSRTLVRATARFNTNRWTFGPGEELCYRLGCGRALRGAQAWATVHYHQRGEAVFEASRDGKTWVELARAAADGTQEMTFPEALFPTRELLFRVRSEGAFQITTLRVSADLAERARAAVGRTVFAQVGARSPELGAKLVGLGDLSTGAPQEVRLALENRARRRFELTLNAEVLITRGRLRAPQQTVVLEPGEKREVAAPCPALAAGEGQLTAAVSDSAGRVLCALALPVAVHWLHAARYGELLAREGGVSIWWARATHKVSRQRPAPQRKAQAIRIEAARNEYEPFQLVLRPEAQLNNVRLSWTDLVGPGGARIAARKITARLVEYVPVTTPTDTLGAPDDYPDPLPPLPRALACRAGENQPIWFTVYVPPQVRAGEYLGRITVAWDGGEAQVPLRLHVWDFTLPRDTHTRTAYGVSPDYSWHGAKGDAERERIFDLYMQDCAAHRISPYSPMSLHPIKWEIVSGAKTAAEKPEEIGVRYDFSEFDRAAQRYLDEFRFTSFNFRCMPGSIAGYKRFTPGYNALHKAIFGPMVEHLRQRGWLAKAYCYWFDEPTEEEYPYVIEGMKLLAESCPGLKRLLTEQPEPPLYGHVDLWVPVLYRYDPERAHARQRAGEEVWWYVCCGPHAPYPNNFIDHPAINHRIRFWMMQKYGVSGSLYWSTTYYRQAQRKRRNPWESPMSISPTGGRWGNGDGMLLYPPTRQPSDKPVISGPVDSIRWELLREGLEDREYMWLLEQAAERAGGARGSRARRVLAKLVDSLVTSLTEFETDPARLYEARRKIAEAIEQLGGQR